MERRRHRETENVFLLKTVLARLAWLALLLVIMGGKINLLHIKQSKVPTRLEF